MTWNTPTYRVVRKMIESGNQPGVVTMWKNMVIAWIEKATGPDAAAVKAFLPLWEIRPYYTAAELAPIFPLLEVALGVSKKPGRQKAPERLANELKFCGLPSFYRNGIEFFVVEQTHKAKEFADAQR